MTTVNKNTFINMRVDQKLKSSSKKVLDNLGIGMGEAVNMFLTQVVLHQGIPFSVKIPNKQTLRSLDELSNKKSSLKKYNSVDAMFADLDK